MHVWAGSAAALRAPRTCPRLLAPTPLKPLSASFALATGPLLTRSAAPRRAGLPRTLPARSPSRAPSSPGAACVTGYSCGGSARVCRFGDDGARMRPRVQEPAAPGAPRKARIGLTAGHAHGLSRWPLVRPPSPPPSPATPGGDKPSGRPRRWPSPTPAPHTYIAGLAVRVLLVREEGRRTGAQSGIAFDSAVAAPALRTLARPEPLPRHGPSKPYTQWDGRAPLLRCWAASAAAKRPHPPLRPAPGRPRTPALRTSRHPLTRPRRRCAGRSAQLSRPAFSPRSPRPPHSRPPAPRTRCRPVSRPWALPAAAAAARRPPAANPAGGTAGAARRPCPWAAPPTHRAAKRCGLELAPPHARLAVPPAAQTRLDGVAAHRPCTRGHVDTRGDTWTHVHTCTRVRLWLCPPRSCALRVPPAGDLVGSRQPSRAARHRLRPGLRGVPELPCR
jgi:hypothetical protein